MPDLAANGGSARMGYPVKKLILNQFGAAIFGIMLSSAAAQNNTLNLITSLFAIFFYMFLQYTCIWDIAAKDRIRVDGGRADKRLNTGLRAALLANIPNFALAVLVFAFTLAGVVTKNEFAGSASIILTAAARFWQGMYNGVIINVIPRGLSGAQTVLSTLIYFAITVPSLICCTVGYIAGYNEKHIFPQIKKKEKNS